MLGLSCIFNYLCVQHGHKDLAVTYYSPIFKTKKEKKNFTVCTFKLAFFPKKKANWMPQIVNSIKTCWTLVMRLQKLMKKDDG